MFKRKGIYFCTIKCFVFEFRVVLDHLTLHFMFFPRYENKFLSLAVSIDDILSWG